MPRDGIKYAIPLTIISRNHPVNGNVDVDVDVDVVVARARCITLAEIAVLIAACPGRVGS
jgi:hypothetical protein